MAKRKHKNKIKPTVVIDEFGKEHLVITPQPRRNEMHFQVQLNTRGQIVESKKHKKPKHKKKLFEEE